MSSDGAAAVLAIVLIVVCLLALATGGVHRQPCPPGTFQAMDGFCTHDYYHRTAPPPSEKP